MNSMFSFKFALVLLFGISLTNILSGMGENPFSTTFDCITNQISEPLVESSGNWPFIIHCVVGITVLSAMIASQKKKYQKKKHIINERNT